MYFLIEQASFSMQFHPLEADCNEHHSFSCGVFKTFKKKRIVKKAMIVHAMSMVTRAEVDMRISLFGYLFFTFPCDADQPGDGKECSQEQYSCRVDDKNACRAAVDEPTGVVKAKMEYFADDTAGV